MGMGNEKAKKQFGFIDCKRHWHGRLKVVDTDSPGVASPRGHQSILPVLRLGYHDRVQSRKMHMNVEFISSRDHFSISNRKLGV